MEQVQDVKSMCDKLLTSMKNRGNTYNHTVLNDLTMKYEFLVGKPNRKCALYSDPLFEKFCANNQLPTDFRGYELSNFLDTIVSSVRQTKNSEVLTALNSIIDTGLYSLVEDLRIVQDCYEKLSSKWVNEPRTRNNDFILKTLQSKIKNYKDIVFVLLFVRFYIRN